MNNIEEGYYDDAYEWMNVEVNNIQIFKSSLAFLSLFFTLSFSLRNYFKYYQLDSLTCNQLVSRIVSSVHAVTVTSMAIWLLLTDNRIGNFVVIYHNFYISLTLNIVIGNMIADIIIMSIYKELFDKTFILHHLLAIIAFYPCSGVGFFPAMALYRLFSEGSTLFINMRWILLTFDMKDSNMYTINAILVLITFTICRVIPIVPMWFICLQYPFVLPIWPSINFGYKALFTVICIILDTLNIHWYFKIIQLIWKFFFLPSNGGASTTSSATNGLLSASSSSASLASSIGSSSSGAPKKDTCND